MKYGLVNHFRDAYQRTEPPRVTAQQFRFDRMLVAQAEVGNLTLVTRNPVFAGYAVDVIAA